jgi:hypothetical protein
MGRLITLFPSEFLDEHAEKLGVVKRDCKLQIPAFVWAIRVRLSPREKAEHSPASDDLTTRLPTRRFHRVVSISG